MILILAAHRFASAYQPLPRVTLSYDRRVEPVRAAVERGDYPVGIAAFARLTAPTPPDHRWLGVCLLNEGHHLEAELRLRQAIAQGDAGAHLFLAALWTSQGKNREALHTLEQVSPDDLSNEDAVLWLRERARTGWALGEPKAQLMEWGTRAWQRGAETTLTVQVSVATFLGSFHSHYGEQEAALAYLRFAAEYAHPRRLEYVLLCQAEVLRELRRFDEAQAALGQITSPVMHTLKGIEQVRHLLAQLRLTEAREAALKLLPDVAGRAAEEFFLRISLLTLATLNGDAAAGWQHLLRAETLVEVPLKRAELDHRAGLFLAAHGDAAGLGRLLQARDAYQHANHLPGLAGVHLALAGVDAERQNEHLRAAALAAAALEAVPDLTLEWALLPAVQEALLTLPAGAVESLLLRTGAAEEGRLHTLDAGTGYVQWGTRRVTFRHRRTAEILAYLRRHPNCRLTDVQRDLFPDVPAARARNYFHQVRVDVALRLPGLEIAFDPGQKTYRFQGRWPLWWDVEELEAALQQGVWPQPAPESVVFLSAAESEWARGERERLSRWLTQVGLETLEDWFRTGEYDRCISLADRLLPLDPLDEGLHTFLLNATYQVRGRVAARSLSRESAATFMREVGEVPPFLEQLVGSWY